MYTSPLKMEDTTTLILRGNSRPDYCTLYGKAGAESYLLLGDVRLDKLLQDATVVSIGRATGAQGVVSLSQRYILSQDTLNAQEEPRRKREHAVR